MRDAAARAGRDAASIRLVAVSKGHGADIIRQAAAAGQTCFCENYVEVLKKKGKEFSALELHFYRTFAEKQNQHALTSHSMPADDRFLGTRGSGRSAPPAKARRFDRSASRRRGDQIGLRSKISHCLGGTNQPSGSHCASRIDGDSPFFGEFRFLLEEINRLGAYKTPLTELSMGMSHDFGVAIEEGATLVRIGAAIFGPRV